MSDEVDRSGTGQLLFNEQAVSSIEYTRRDASKADDSERTFNAVLKNDDNEVVGKLENYEITDLSKAIGLGNAVRINRGEQTGTLQSRDIKFHVGYERNEVSQEPAKELDKTPVRVAEQADTALPSPAPERKQRERETIDTAPRENAELKKQVQAQFNVQGNRYLLKDRDNSLAFTEKDTKLVATSNDERVAKALALLAEAKGWQSIKVTGHPVFKQAVWKAASERGLEVKGYKPTEQDREQLAEQTARQTRNTVEKSEPRKGTREAAQATIDTPATSALPNSSKSDAKEPRTHEGTIVAFGSAPYKFKPNAKHSYRVVLDGKDGKTEVWGKDLERAIAESNVEPGNRVVLTQSGAKPVTVKEDIRDQAGNVTGQRDVQRSLNIWNVRPVDRGTVTEAVAGKLIDEKIGDPELRKAVKTAIAKQVEQRERYDRLPPLPIYDKQAPAATQTPERTQTPTPERAPESTR